MHGDPTLALWRLCIGMELKDSEGRLFGVVLQDVIVTLEICRSQPKFSNLGKHSYVGCPRDLQEHGREARRSLRHKKREAA